MYRLTLAGSLKAPITPIRSFSSTARSLQKGPPTTQGHSTDKAHQTGHSDGDVQSASVRAGQNAKDNASPTAQGEAQPFDAARQGSSGGTAKSSEAKAEVKDPGQAGSFKDQVGGQDESAPGVEFGKTEKAPGGSYTDSVKETAKSGFDGLKKLRSEGKNFHTSARQLYPGKGTSPSADNDGSRQPKELNLEGEQNQHLKHQAPGTADQGKGNAAETPHLPSRKGDVTTGGSGAPTAPQSGKKAFSTYNRQLMAAQPPKEYAKALTSEGEQAGYNAPSEGFPRRLDETYTSEATPSPEPGQTPSSKAEYSSTAVDPPNGALRAAAKDGTLAERNEQPHAEFGKLGNKEAWKHRK
ncbi:hypothetical protein I203_103657 [Kwoniella mangroviensis CBS 8507]|uniref:uncharacterized protein n=1 Tax=Kwoniella mangroviensis CBS 8507 TaxID=1296122 RepID=UPI00080D3261|nr:uncharacterized protein I203_04248 [Kwoniella mangroviensis CBS 8507]OCF66672.1 hypothetical protein I203_04248 [Kwoniella mangroviensis CBS 8507]